jgi:hypothetical protein
MFSKSIFSYPMVFPGVVVALIIAFVCVEWLQREKEHALELDNLNIPRFFKFGFYYTIIIIIFLFGGQQQDFIYFQF